MLTEAVFTYIKKEFKKLRESYPALESLIEGTNYGLAVMTKDCRLVEVNSTLREWFPGLDVESSPLCHEAFCFSTQGRCSDCPAAKCIVDGKKHTAVIASGEGKNFTSFKVSSTPVRGPDGNIWAVLNVLEDITATVQQEQAIRDLEAKSRLIIENANDAILTFKQDGTIIQTNRKAHELFGYSAEELVGRSVHMLFPEEVREEQKEAVCEFFQPGRETKYKIVLSGVCLRKDGTTVPIEQTSSLHKSAQGDSVTLIIRDVSERKRYEEQLRNYAEALKEKVAARTRELVHSEERHRTVVETANEGIILINARGHIISWNRCAKDMYGYAAEDIIGRPVTILMPERFKAAHEHMFNSAPGPAAGPDTYHTTEGRGLRKDGSEFMIEQSVVSWRMEKELFFTYMVRDITGRKKLEQELQDYTAKLEERVRERTQELTNSQQILKEKVTELSILKEISEALSSAMELDAVLTIILVGATSHHGLGFNRTFLFLLNEEGTCLEGKVAIGPSDNDEAQKIWGKILGENLSLNDILYSYTNAQGQIDSHVNNIVKSIRIPATDEQNILIQALRKRETFNITDAQNHPLVPEELAVKMGSNAFALVPLVADDEVLGLIWADNAITHNAIENRDMDLLRSFAVSASLAIQKSDLYKKLQSKVVELDNANRQLKENRDRLIRTEKLVAVGEMAANVAHGIRNPLVSIGGFARRLLKKESYNSTNRKYLQIIVDEIDRLESILSDLLDFVRPTHLNLKKVSLNDLIEQTLQVFFFQFQQNNIAVERNLLSTLVPTALDPDQFKRVFYNLFTNAIDAMPDGGSLKIATRIEDVWIKISIADTGRGIEEDDREKVFHPFFSRKATGSGLGLAISNQIVALHGGRILLQVDDPPGVVFEIYLPAQEPAEHR